MYPSIDIDSELNYCPRCHDEYRADILTCAPCAIQLVSGAQMLALQAERHPQSQSPSRSLKIESGEALLTVRKGPMQQIKALQATLLVHGLPSLVTKESGGNCGCGGPELVLQIRESDLPEVMGVLDQEYRQSTALSDHDTRYVDAVYDTDAAEAQCPACGYRFATNLVACPDCGLCFT